MVIDIQKFSIHDGPGIRTTVFLKGCSLRCRWCHNPESLRFEPDVLFHPERCIDCEQCERAFPGMGVRRTLSQQGLSGETRQRLAGLGTICPSGAIERAGRDMTIDDILDIVDQDRPFYEASGGGLTLSGGEPLANPAFSIELARQAKARQLHVCLQTSGCGSPEAVKGIVPFVDLFLWDIKDTDAARLKANTGGDLETMAANLSLADAMGAATVLACLMIPDVNMNEAHYRGIAGLYERLQHCRGVKLTPYHPFGISKYEQLGLPVPDGRFRTPGSDRMAEAKRRLEALGVKVQSD